jgi:hypothetical protein
MKNIITISIVITMVAILTIGTISTNLVFGQAGPRSQGPVGTSQIQGQGNINPQGSGFGCGTAHCSHDPFQVGDGSGYTGGYGSGGTIVNPDHPSGIDADGGGAGYGQEIIEGGTNHCGAGSGGAYNVFTGERIGGGVGGGGSCREQ